MKVLPLLALAIFLGLLPLVPASAQSDIPAWERGYPQRDGNGCVEYVAQWSDGSYTATPWDCEPGAAAERDGIYADRGYPQRAANGCIEYVTVWNDGSYTWVPFACPPGIPYYKPVEAADVGPALPPPPPIREFPILKESKLGLGVYASGGHVMQALQRMEPGVILLQEPSVEFAAEVRRNFPRAFIIGKRFQTAGQPLDNPSARGATYADYVAQLAVPLKGTVDAWQSYNEPIGGGDIAQYQAWNAFQVAFAERLQGHYGISAVAGNDPAGAMQPEDYPRYFGDAIRASAYFGVHLYSSGKPPFRLNEPGAEWYILRYRKIHEALEAAGIHNVKMIVTESGHGEGWRHKLDMEDVVADFFWLTAEMEKDPYVIGHAIFGFFDEGGNWGEFNLSAPILDQLRAYPAVGQPVR